MQINKARKKAYTEVCEVLNHMTKTDVDKIPNEILTYYSDNSDKKYNFKIDETKTFAEQQFFIEIIGQLKKKKKVLQKRRRKI